MMILHFKMADYFAIRGTSWLREFASGTKIAFTPHTNAAGKDMGGVGARSECKDVRVFKKQKRVRDVPGPPIPH